MSTSSSQKLYVTFVALGEVVIRSFGGVFGSQSEKYDANGSESMSAEVSWATDTSPESVVIRLLEPSMGWEVGSVLSRVCRGSAVKTEGSNSRWLSSVLGTFCANLF